MPSNQTPNYQLNQWEAGDRVQRTDFNADNAKIDAVLAGKAEQSALAALTRTVDGKGNCRILTGSYVGTGSYGHALDLGVKPKLLIVAGPLMHAVFLHGQTRTSALTYSNGGYSIDVTWAEDGQSLSWYSSKSQATGLNAEGTTYSYVVFY